MVGCESTMRKMVKILVFLMLIACSSKPNVIKPDEEIIITGEQEIFVVNHDWHTGFVIPAKRIQVMLPELGKRFGNTPYMEFGWGDKDFYQAQEITTALTFRAIFLPTESVVHVVAVPDKVNEYFPKSEIAKLCISNRAYSSLIRFISNSFLKNDKDQITRLKIGIYGNSQFYKGAGHYYLKNTCNEWTARGLASAGMDISPAFKLSAESIMSYLKDYQQALTIACH